MSESRRAALPLTTGGRVTMLAVTLLLVALVVLSSTPAAPFVYTIF